MFTKRNIIIVIIILVLIGGFFYYRSRSTGEVLQTEKVRRGSVSETVSVTGELVPKIFADLSFQTTGTMDTLSVKEGDAVRAGQAVASLDSSVLQSQLNEARIAQALAEKDERLARHGWDNLKQEERDTKKLVSEKARKNVQTVIAQINARTIFAPFDGKISKVDARVGEVVTFEKVIARVAQDGDFLIEARVPESDIAKVTMDMRAQITFDALSPDEIFDAEVVEIALSSTTVQDVVSYIVKFHLAKTDDRLKDGMTANIDIETAKKENVLLLPFRALVKEGGKTYAEVKRGENQLEKVEVATVLEGDEGLVEIKSGLKEGDEIVISTKQNK
jgi:membrane fusion protein, macrolide-specific efflux system